MARLYFVIFILISILSFSGCDSEPVGKPPTLFRVIPKEFVPSNSSIVFVFAPAVRLESLSINVNNIKGKIQPLYPSSHVSTANEILWTPIQNLPLGEAKISIKGEGGRGLPIELKHPLDITVVEPDHVPPKLVDAKPETRAIDEAKTQLQLHLKFSEPINWHNLKGRFEPAPGSNVSLYSEDYQTAIVSRVLVRGIDYTFKLTSIVDLAGNIRSDETVSIKAQ